jgi:diguanylate cyclase (GGDEF)-like protein/PAS domain S-box-containing protein
MKNSNPNYERLAIEMKMISPKGDKQAWESLHYKSIVDSLTIPTFLINAQHIVVAWNRACEALTGVMSADIIGKNPDMLSSDKQPPEFYKQMWRDLTAQGHWEGEVWNRRKDGVIYPDWLSISKVVDESTQDVSHYIAIFSDIAKHKQSEEEATRLAFYDPLTDLPNRLLLRDRLNQAIASAKRGNSLVAVMCIDIDGFKAVNDHYGHETGDLLLQEIATRMRGCLRQSDTVARFGGDEFVVILPEVAIKTNIHVVAYKLLKITEDLEINDNPIHITLSIGVAVYPQNGDNVDVLLQNAEKAMHKVKESGKNGFQFFQHGISVQSLTFRNK